MTMHYQGKKIEDMTSELVLMGWRYHGCEMPGAFAVLSEGDSVAYNCWCYMSMTGKDAKIYLKLLAYEELPSIKDYCKRFEPKKFSNKIKEILNKLVETGEITIA